MKKATILGAIAGDAIGSIYEFNPTKDYNFTLLDPRMEITDDSIMTIAVADWILNDPRLTLSGLAKRMRYHGQNNLYPMGGYGGNFKQWLLREELGAYNSWGNGSAMRVSACGFAFNTLEETLEAAKRSAEVTHNHPEGVKGAQATAAAIFMARTGKSKEEIREYITQKFGYDLSRTCNDIRPSYHFEDSCQNTVPQSIIAFLDSKDYEDAIRLTVSLGGDADTMGAITGAIAIAYYKEMPDEIYNFTMARIPNDLKEIVETFEARFTPADKSAIDICGNTELTQQCGVTPPKITSLKENEIFVFGSNLEGMHGGGAARYAYDRFGAVWGCGVGIQGKSYAIPTMHGPIKTIKPYVDQFLNFARHNPRKHFLVTRIGCGIAGFKAAEIAPLFAEALAMPNVSLPQEFIDIILPQPPTVDLTPEEEKILKKWKFGLGNMGKSLMGEDPMPSKKVIATKDSWKTKPMPKENETISIDFTLPTEAMEIIKRGHIPAEMEDHWFMYCDDNTIRYYRSWTGICIYEANYKIVGDKTLITTLTVNRNPEQYKATDIHKDMFLFLALVTDEYGGNSANFWDLALS